MSAAASGREPVTYLAWTSRPGRALDISAALGAKPVVLYPRIGRSLPHPAGVGLRYLVSGVQTLVAFARYRPRTVIATNPPMFPALLALAWTALTGGRFVLDSHPSAFGAKGRRIVARLQPLHRWLARRAAAVLVTTRGRAREVDSWGGHGLVMHEAPSSFPPPSPPATPTVLFTGVFAQDEPIREVLGAAAMLRDVQFRMTGDPAAADRAVLAEIPPNVTLTGYLAQDAYRHEVAGATLILTLTTERTSIMRSACEAVYAGVPLVTTDTPDLREAFPYAVFCDNSTESIAEAVGRALADIDALRSSCATAVKAQQRQWEAQLTQLRQACSS
jgi:glycosyltransferase involved in cell wall biosynthesis